MTRFPTLVSLLLCATLQTSALAESQSMVEETTHDFGVVPRGTILKHQFRIHNPLTSPMRVAGVRTSCVCSSAAVSRTQIAPGQSAVVAVTVDTHKFSGPRTFTIYVTIDEPFLEEFRFMVQATSRDEITLEPGELNFGRIVRGSKAEARVRIEYYGFGAWAVTGVDNDNGYLLPELKQVPPTAGRIAYELKVSLRSDIPIGAWHADLWLTTTDPNQPKIRVPLVVEVAGALTATPKELDFGRVSGGDGITRRIVIRGTSPFKVVRIQGADDVVEVSNGGDKPRRVHVLRVRVHPEQLSGELERTIRVITDRPGQESVSFTVHAVPAS